MQKPVPTFVKCRCGGYISFSDGRVFVPYHDEVFELHHPQIGPGGGQIVVE